MTPEETENQMGGYGKVISHVIIGLKSVKGTKQLKLDPTIFDSLQKEKVQVTESGQPRERTVEGLEACKLGIEKGVVQKLKRQWAVGVLL